MGDGFTSYSELLKFSQQWQCKVTVTASWDVILRSLKD